MLTGEILEQRKSPHVQSGFMSRSIHATRHTFRKAAKFNYSRRRERVQVLGNTLMQLFMKRCAKDDALIIRDRKREGADYSKIYRSMRRCVVPKRMAVLPHFAKKVEKYHMK